MKRRSLAISLDESAETPVFLQIARALTAAIRSGRLGPGDPLPSSRALAAQLGVHRNTVLAAYEELRAEGWIEALAARRTQVAASLPIEAARPGAARGRRAARAGGLGFDLPELDGPAPEEAPPPGAMILSGGVPDLRLVPRTALARAYRRALLRRGDDPLAYGDPRGDAGLRREVAAMLSAERGLAVGADDLLITRGSQMAIALCAQALLRPGDAVAVEAMGYRPAWDALARRAELLPVPIDDEGIDVDALAALVERRPIRAVYLTPHHQFPTTALLSAARRIRLLALARARRFAVIEDDYDNEIHYSGRPVLPLASADRDGLVIYVGTLSKILAPGLRVGFLSGPAPVIARATALRERLDRQGDHAVEAALAELLEDGEIGRHARRMRRVYQGRREALCEALAARLGGALSFRLPAGGMAIWARADPTIDVDAWARRAAARGVVVATARRFAFDGQPRPCLRLGFAAWTEEELWVAIGRLAAALDGRGSPRRRSG